MLSHFSVARIKDKTAHSSLNHLLFSTAVTFASSPALLLPRSPCGKFTAILYSFSRFAFRLHPQEEQGPVQRSQRQSYVWHRICPQRGHGSARALGDAERSLPGSAAQLLRGTRLSRLVSPVLPCIGGAYPFSKQEGTLFVLYKSCLRTHGKTIRCPPSPTCSHASLEVSSPL